MLSKFWLYLNRTSMSGGRAALGHGGLHRRIGQIELVHGLQIAADRFGAERHRAIDPGADPRRAAALDVAAEAGRDFDGGLDVAALQALLEIGIVWRAAASPRNRSSRAAPRDRRGSRGSGRGRARRSVEIVDVGRNPKPEHQHQERSAEQREAEADGVAQQAPAFRGWCRRRGAAG